MTRPYCDLELADIDADISSKYRLSSIKAWHAPCLHNYLVKKGGKKEQFLFVNGDNVLDELTCSICFKIRTKGLEFINESIVDDVCKFRNKLDINYLKNKDLFYRWLYQHDY